MQTIKHIVIARFSMVLDSLNKSTGFSSVFFFLIKTLYLIHCVICCSFAIIYDIYKQVLSVRETQITYSIIFLHIVP